MQVRTLFVTATGTGVGKTHTTLKLIDALARKGLRVGVCKPVETGVDTEPEDAALLLQALRKVNPAFCDLKPADLCAYTFPLPAAPFCADTARRIEKREIFDKISELSGLCDLLLIEGAGGLMVPITEEWFMIDLIRELKAHALLVTPSRLGCINETLLSLEALKRREIPHDWCVNLYEDAEEFPKVTRPFYDTRFPGWWTLQEGLDRFVKRMPAT
jgi:dethiobiotin synthetase